MEEKKGHFEKGRWIEDIEEEESFHDDSGNPEENPGNNDHGSVEDFDKKISELKSSVSKNLNDLFGLGKDLLTTEKGRKHLAKKVKKAEEKIENTIEDIAEGFEKAIKK